MFRPLVRTALFVIALAPPAGAQQRLGAPPGPAFALFRPAPTPPPAQPAAFIHTSTRDYRWELFAVGAIAVGVFGISVAQSWCHDPDNGLPPHCARDTAVCFLVGASLGGLVGGLVGLAINKPPPIPKNPFAWAD